ncbi:hypothetical protein CAAN1_03S06216 [[Candida] anglica]|uniref:BHLH domain-containing protein n=1 Tax=[Candida] anglica TaxID=148631 RepID=A0ABP0EJG0_9ASCO
MSFKINDYNAYLTTLFDRNTRDDGKMRDMASKHQLQQLQQLQQLHQQQQQQQQQAQSQSQQQMQQDIMQMNDSPQINSSEFPLDFDFGLIPGAAKSPGDPLNQEFALESSLPDQNFDLFGERLIKQEPYSPISLQPPTSADAMQVNQPYQPTNTRVKREEKRHQSASAADSMTPPPMFSPTDKSSRPRAKSSHNLIEQRYRNKINDRFEALQDCVPTLRVVSQNLGNNRHSKRDDEDEEEDEGSDMVTPLDGIPKVIDLEGLEPARKLSKGTILTKSIEYIKFLETKNLRLKLQQEELLAKAQMMGVHIEQEDLI